jgi:hypothetical protein
VVEPDEPARDAGPGLLLGGVSGGRGGCVGGRRGFFSGRVVSASVVASARVFDGAPHGLDGADGAPRLAESDGLDGARGGGSEGREVREGGARVALDVRAESRDAREARGEGEGHRDGAPAEARAEQTNGRLERGDRREGVDRRRRRRRRDDDAPGGGNAAESADSARSSRTLGSSTDVASAPVAASSPSSYMAHSARTSSTASARPSASHEDIAGGRRVSRGDPTAALARDARGRSGVEWRGEEEGTKGSSVS